MTNSRSGDTGEGIHYEDCVKVSAILHYYIGSNFLGHKITEIQLNPFTEIETDDFHIKTESGMSLYVQVKLSIESFGGEPFKKFVVQAFKDYSKLKDNSLHFFLITQNISDDMFKSFSKLIKLIKAKPYSYYILETDNNLKLFNQIKKILPNTVTDIECYDFLKNITLEKKVMIDNKTAIINDDDKIMIHFFESFDDSETSISHVISFIDNFVKSHKKHSVVINNQILHIIFEGIVSNKRNSVINSFKEAISNISFEFNDLLNDLTYSSDVNPIDVIFRKNSAILKTINQTITKFKNNSNLLDNQTSFGYYSLKMILNIIRIIDLDIKSIKTQNFSGFAFSFFDFDDEKINASLNYDFEKRLKMFDGEIFPDYSNDLFISNLWYSDKKSLISFYSFLIKSIDIIIGDNYNFLNNQAILKFTRNLDKDFFEREAFIECFNKVAYFANQDNNIPLFLVNIYESYNIPDRRFSVPLLIGGSIKKILIKMGNPLKNNISIPLCINDKYIDREIINILMYLGYVVYCSIKICSDPKNRDNEWFLYLEFMQKFNELEKEEYLNFFFDRLVYEYDADDNFMNTYFHDYPSDGDRSDLIASVDKMNTFVNNLSTEEFERFKDFYARGSDILKLLNLMVDNDDFFSRSF